MTAHGFLADVYRNLHKDLYSVRILEGPSKGRVVAHCSRIMVENAEFVVSERGRQRVIEERRKNVHAFIRGRVVAMSGKATAAGRAAGLGLKTAPFASARSMKLRAKGEDVTYNPFKGPTFHKRSTGQPVVSCNRAFAMIRSGKARVIAVRPRKSR